MSTLLLRLCAPMQSWGLHSKFDRRTTEPYPTKSAVIGMIAAAFGRSRDESIDDLAAVRFGVRVDRKGILLRDFHTAKSVKSKFPYVTNRYYLCDAAFLVGLEGTTEQLTEIEEALSHPYYPLYLGRRSCPPTGRISLGIRETNLEQTLETEPLLCDNPSKIVRILVESKEGYLTRDVPVSFDIRHRQYTYRRIKEYSVPIGNELIKEKRTEKRAEMEETEHDPMGELL